MFISASQCRILPINLQPCKSDYHQQSISRESSARARVFSPTNQGWRKRTSRNADLRYHPTISYPINKLVICWICDYWFAPNLKFRMLGLREKPIRIEVVRQLAATTVSTINCNASPLSFQWFSCFENIPWSKRKQLSKTLFTTRLRAQKIKVKFLLRSHRSTSEQCGNLLIVYTS